MIHGVLQTAPCSLMSPRGKPPQAGIHGAELSFSAGFLEMKGKLPAKTEIPTDFLTAFGHSLHYPQRFIWNQNYFIFRIPCFPTILLRVNKSHGGIPSRGSVPALGLDDTGSSSSVG